MGRQYCDPSRCHPLILVDQPTEDVSAPDISCTCGSRWFLRLRDVEREAPVRPVLVVAAGVGSKHPFEVPASQHHDPVEALGPHG